MLLDIKETISRVEKHSTILEKIFFFYLSETGSMSRIYQPLKNSGRITNTSKTTLGLAHCYGSAGKVNAYNFISHVGGGT